jgi:hypothetical protein
MFSHPDRQNNSFRLGIDTKGTGSCGIQKQGFDAEQSAVRMLDAATSHNRNIENWLPLRPAAAFHVKPHHASDGGGEQCLAHNSGNVLAMAL